MDFWSTYEKKRGEPDFGARQLWLSTGERYNASIERLRERSVELAPNRALFQEYLPERRYLVAKEIGFDTLFSFYDVNSKGILAVRPTGPLYGKEVGRIEKLLKRFRKPNIEMRAIGLQNGDTAFTETVERLHKRVRCNLVEVDLFGNQTRHVIIDLLTGKPYSLLLENRIYRPGELINQGKREEFEKTRSKLDFV